MRWILKFALALPAVCLFLTSPAPAQFILGPSWETTVTLTQADLDMIKSTLMTRIHNHNAGTRAAWNNPQSGNSGTIALLSVVPRGAQRCEQIEYHNIPPHGAPSDRFVLTSCIQPDGSWRLS